MLVFLLYLLAILGFVRVTLLMNRCSGPQAQGVGHEARAVRVRRDAGRHAQREGGADQVLRGRHRFLLFDLETVFLYIWALGAQPLTGFMLLTFFIFVFLLVAILLYVYQARLLEAVTE